MFLWSVECLSIKQTKSMYAVKQVLSTVESTGEIFEALTLVKLYNSAVHYSSIVF